MAKSQRVYTPEFRRQMVELYRAGRGFDELAKDCDVGPVLKQPGAGPGFLQDVAVRGMVGNAVHPLDRALERQPRVERARVGVHEPESKLVSGGASWFSLVVSCRTWGRVSSTRLPRIASSRSARLRSASQMSSVSVVSFVIRSATSVAQ